MIGVLVIGVPLRSWIDVARAQTVFLKEDSKNKISISHILEGN